VSIKNFIKDLLIYHKSISATTQEPFQTAFGTEKIYFPVLFGFQGFSPGDERAAYRVLHQDIRFPVFQGPGGLGPEPQRDGHLFDDPVTHISQAQTKE
jgi:hypothetical protein